MTNSENFDAEVEQVDAEFEEEAVVAPGKPPKPAKSGGGAGKFIVLLLVLGIGGALGAEYMGLIKLPVDIPGVTPAAKVAVNTDTPATPAENGLPPAAPADLAQTGITTPATGSDINPPAAPADPMAAAAAAATPAEPTALAPAMIPGAIGAQVTDGTKIVAPGDRDPFADLPPVAGTPAAGTETAAATSPADPVTPTITPPAAIGITPPESLTAPTPATSDPLSAPLNDAAATGTGTDTPVMTAADPAPAASDPAVQGKIESLEAQVSALEQGTTTLKSENEAKDAQIAKLEADLAAAKAARSSSAASAAAETGEEPAVTAPKKRRVRTAVRNNGGAAPVVSGQVTSRWILKSAKPGMAWVAPPGSSELKSVAVGDTLTGVGRVTAIARDEAGRWYVSGTRGRIRQ